MGGESAEGEGRPPPELASLFQVSLCSTTSGVLLLGVRITRRRAAWRDGESDGAAPGEVRGKGRRGREGRRGGGPLESIALVIPPLHHPFPLRLFLVLGQHPGAPGWGWRGRGRGSSGPPEERPGPGPRAAMKSRRRRRRQHRKLLFLLGLYTLVLLLLPYALDGRKRGEEAAARRCPGLPSSLGVWSLEAAAGEEEEEEEEGDVRTLSRAAGGAPGSPRNGSASARRPPRAKTHVYLHATWRTGSSFLGELFNQHPDVFYLYEPMWHLWQALYPGDAESLQGALRDMLRSLFRCDFSVLRLYSPPGDPAAPAPASANLTTAALFGWKTNKVICSAPLCPAASKPRAEMGLIDGAACERSCPPVSLRELEAECRKYPVVVIKDVRLLDLGVLVPLLRDPGLHLKVIQLFRDPRAVHNSRLKSKQALVRESIQVLRTRQKADRFHRLLLAQGAGGRPGASLFRAQPPGPRADFFLSGALEVICEAWLRDLVFAGSSPAWLRRRYTRLRYEDLVLDPRAQLARLLRFAGLPTLPALEDFALNMTRGSSYSADRPFLISARDAREAVHAWRERLSLEQVRQVEASCGQAMRLLAYPLRGEEGAGGGGESESGPEGKSPGQPPKEDTTKQRPR